MCFGIFFNDGSRHTPTHGMPAVLLCVPFIAQSLSAGCARTGGDALGGATGAPCAAMGDTATAQQPEAEYPQPLCNALARGIGRCIEKGLDGGAFEFDFSEFFSGPRAPLTKTVERISVETRNATAARAVKGDGPRDETKEQAHPAMVGVGR